MPNLSHNLFIIFDTPQFNLAISVISFALFMISLFPLIFTIALAISRDFGFCLQGYRAQAIHCFLFTFAFPISIPSYYRYVFLSFSFYYSLNILFPIVRHYINIIHHYSKRCNCYLNVHNKSMLIYHKTIDIYRFTILFCQTQDKDTCATNPENQI